MVKERQKNSGKWILMHLEKPSEPEITAWMNSFIALLH